MPLLVVCVLLIEVWATPDDPYEFRVSEEEEFSVLNVSMRHPNQEGVNGPLVIVPEPTGITVYAAKAYPFGKLEMTLAARVVPEDVSIPIIREKRATSTSALRMMKRSFFICIYLSFKNRHS